MRDFSTFTITFGRASNHYTDVEYWPNESDPFFCHFSAPGENTEQNFDFIFFSKLEQVVLVSLANLNQQTDMPCNH